MQKETITTECRATFLRIRLAQNAPICSISLEGRRAEPGTAQMVPRAKSPVASATPVPVLHDGNWSATPSGPEMSPAFGAGNGGSKFPARALPE